MVTDARRPLDAGKSLPRNSWTPQMNHLHYWKIEASPFAPGAPKRFFYHGGSIDEAVARVSFLLENRRELGLVLGPNGVGKTSLLRNLKWFASQAGNSVRPEFVYQSLTGLLHSELPRRLVMLLNTVSQNDFANRPIELTWRDLEDAAASISLQQQRLVFLLDDIDQANSQVWDDIARLHLLSGGATCILACSSDQQRCIPGSWLDRCELRVDLPLWDLSQTAQYFEWALERAKAAEDLFDAQAITRIHELGNGEPRRMLQLAELGLVAGAVRRVPYISGPLIDQVSHELPESSQVSHQAQQIAYV